ncbi:MAG TPA: hypothetical protein GXX14_10255 [Clostridiaceae bacterium]|nr:hypothetical protein [Clostridiaceae bacterium]
MDDQLRVNEVVYNPEKDFYKGVSGELRLKAEGLFKKAKEKGISIEEIEIKLVKENKVDFPGIGTIELPAYIVKVKGRDIKNGQVMVDGKQIDYYNRFQKYIADKIEEKNSKRETEKKPAEGSEVSEEDDFQFILSDKEMFDIGKLLINDKEFGLEKTITGGCDRVIRKLMGENDWLYPEEAKMLDEEFNSVQAAILKEDTGINRTLRSEKKATERQINYLKAKIRNYGLDPENEAVIKEILREAGFNNYDLNDLSIVNMSKLIDMIGEIVMKMKNTDVDKEENRYSRDDRTELN